MSFRLVPLLYMAVIVLINVCLPKVTSGGTDVDVTTSLTVGNRTGLFASLYASEDAVTDPEQRTGIVSSQVIVTPGFILGLSTRRTIFELNYALELSNYVAREEEFRLNMYQQAGLRSDTALSRTLNFVADANGRIGFLDYSRALYSFEAEGEISPNLPQTQELRFYNVNASIGLLKQWARRAGSGIVASYNMRSAFGYDDDEAPFPDYYQCALTAEYHYAVTRRDVMMVDASGALVLFSPGDDFVPVRMTTGWSHDLSENARFRLSGGVMVAYQLNINQETTDETPDSVYTGSSGLYWMPRGSIEYHQLFHLKGRKIFSIDLSGDFDAYFDQVSASVTRQMLFGIGGSLRLPSEWEFAVQGTFSSLGRIDPVDSNQGVPPPEIEYPTVAALNASASYPITREIQLLIGLNSSARWSDFGDEEFRARAFEQFIVYVSISASRNHLEP